MATTRIDAQQVTVAGVVPAYTAADLVNGNNFVPNAGRIVLLQNAGGSSATVTFVTPAVVAGLAVADDAVVVAAGTTRAVSIADPTAFISPAGSIDFTSSAAVNVAVLQS